MPQSARDVLLAYVAAQKSGSVDDVFATIADDAVFDVGRGRYEGRAAIREFHERLQRIHSTTHVVRIDEHGPTQVTAEFAQSDDDLRPLEIDAIRLNVAVQLGADGRIVRFTARPTPEALARIAAARDAGRTSEGVRAAERTGTLPDDR
jgi:hypothetical protein